MNYILERLKEPSTHAGVAMLFVAAAAFFPQYSQIILGIAAAFGFSAVAVPEVKK